MKKQRDNRNLSILSAEERLAVSTINSIITLHEDTIEHHKQIISINEIEIEKYEKQIDIIFNNLDNREIQHTKIQIRKYDA